MRNYKQSAPKALASSLLLSNIGLAQILILLYASYMVYKKWAKLVLFAYLILALIGSAAISAGEAFYIENLNDDSLNSGRYFSSINQNLDWLAANVLTLRKARSFSNSLLRNRLLRIFTFTGIFSIALYLVGENLKIIKNDNIQIIKNLVPLKLRI
jgi:hypothetical protein